MRVEFLSLASGSSGNCYYVGCDSHGLLIDAGIGARTIKKRLTEAGIPMERLRGVLITHDHADHVKSAAALAERFSLPIYATAATHRGLAGKPWLGGDLRGCGRFLEKNCPTQIGAFRVEAFEVPHDGTDNVGYSIETDDGKTFCFLTDLGEITPEAACHIARANYLVIEANYDADMLQHGPYPPLLKQRILARTGHLCNDTTARFLADHFPPGLKNIWLCHLSRDNNTPQLAYEAVKTRLREVGVEVGRDVELCCLERYRATRLYTFD